MKKSLLSVLGLAVALAFSMPVLGNAASTAAATTTTTTAPAAAAPAAAAPAKAEVKKVATKKAPKACKVTKTHKCPVKKAKKAAPKKA